MVGAALALPTPTMAADDDESTTMCPTNSTRLYSISAAPLLGETLVYGRLTRAGGHVPRDRDVPGHEGLGARPCLGRIQLDVCLPLPRRLVVATCSTLGRIQLDVGLPLPRRLRTRWRVPEMRP